MKAIKKFSVLFIILFIGMIIFFLLNLIQPSMATEVTLNPTDDTSIHLGVDVPQGNVEQMTVRNDYGDGGSTGFEWDVLIKFNISSIPPNSSIVSASLKLFYFQWRDTNPAGRNLNIYRVTSNWDEDTTCWNNQPSYAGTPTYFATVPESTDTWMEWNVTEDIQSYIDDESTNYGWKVTDENYWGQGNIPIIDFRTKEYGSLIPYLEIEYESNTWWDSDWQYCKMLNIDNAVNDYQILINVSKNTGGGVNCSDHCNDDFSDIRFIDIDNSTVLDYWVEAKVDGCFARIWVKLPSDIETDGKILMYYGNPTVQTISNGSNTFIFFDDFDSYNSDVWEEYDPNNAATIDIQNGNLRINFVSCNGGSTSGIRTKNTISTDGLIVAKVKGEKGSNLWNQPFCLGINKEDEYQFMQNKYRETGTNSENQKYYTGFHYDDNTVVEQYSSDTYNELDWRIVYIKKLQNYQAGGCFLKYFDEDRFGYESTYNYPINDPFNLVICSHSFENDLESYCDWVFVANFSQVEPYIPSVGDELTNSAIGIIACWHFDEGSGSIAYDSIGDNDATINGASWTTGISGTALDFDGLDDLVNCGDTLTGNILDKVTVEAFVCDYSTSPFERDYIFYDGSDGEFCLKIIEDRRALFHVKLSDGLLGYDINSTTTLQNGIWYHVAGIYDYSNSLLKIYVNGQLENTTTIPNLHLYNPSGNYYPTIGAYSSATDSHRNYFDGIIDEVNVYSFVLSDSEILSHYQQYFPTPNIVYVDDDYTSSTPGWQYDHFDVIHDGIDAVAEGGTVYVYNGIYYENVIVDKTIDLIGEDRNYTIVHDGGQGTLMQINANLVNVSNFSFYNVSGSNFGIILKSNGSIIKDNIFSPSFTNCALELIHSDYNKIINNTYKIQNDYSYIGDGILLTYSDDNLIISNDVIIGGCGIDLHYSNNNIIDTNHIQSAFSVALVIDNCNDTIIKNNLINNSHYGIWIDYGVRNLIANNVVNYNGDGVTEQNFDNCYTTYENNTLSFNEGDGFSISGASHVLIINNTVSYNTGHGIHFYCVELSTIENNSINYNHLSGIFLDLGKQCRINFNDIKLNRRNGIYSNSTGLDYVSGNIIQSNFGDGLKFYCPQGGFVGSSVIVSNLILENEMSGINLTRYVFNNISSNFIQNNLNHGISLNDSPCNTIFNNYFNNDDNVLESFSYSSQANQWNITKISGTNIIGGPYLGGNYWNDYNGIDTDGDELGNTETPYGPGDFLPLVYPGNVPPIADADGPYSGVMDDSIHFDGSGSYDPDGTIVSYEWNFADGYTGSGVTPSHQYTSTGTYHVNLTVTDNDGLTDTDVTTVYIGFGNVPMILLTNPSEGDIVKDTISIEWTAHDSEDGSNLPIYLYLFDSDDDMTPFPNNPYENTGSLLWDTTDYPDGEYKLLIEASDSDNNLGVDSCHFQIKNHEDPIENHAPNKPTKPQGETSGKAGEEYTYSTTGSDVDDDLMWFKWDWGDGNYSEWEGPYTTLSLVQSSHTWDDENDYQIKVKAKDEHGLESEWSDPLSITMPKIHNYNPILQLIFRMLERFSFLKSILFLS